MSFKFRDHIKNNMFITTIFSEDKKIIYMKPGRTASTSIYRGPLQSLNVREANLPYWKYNGTCDWLENITDEEIFNDYFIFTIVRNPFERLISAWYAFVVKNRAISDFGEFIGGRGSPYLLDENGKFNNEHWLPLHYYVEFDENNSFIDFVGKYENLNDDWKFIAEKIGASTVLPYDTNSIGKHRYYREYYTDELVEIVSDFYKRDLELFNYEF